MHQYTSEDRVNGINGNVDMSWCYVDFASIIKSNGFNGFSKTNVEETIPVFTSKRMLISAFDGAPMSKGDVIAFSELLSDLKIKYEATVEGYIITIDEVGYNELVVLNCKADDIGNIEVKEYVVDAEHPEKCAECDLLAKEIAELNANLDIVTNMTDGYAKDLEVVTENLINTRKELSVANSAWAAERGSNELYVAENSQLKDKLNKIKEIVGG